jgi:hypothetical protein
VDLAGRWPDPKSTLGQFLSWATARADRTDPHAALRKGGSRRGTRGWRSREVTVAADATLAGCLAGSMLGLRPVTDTHLRRRARPYTSC